MSILCIEEDVRRFLGWGIEITNAFDGLRELPTMAMTTGLEDGLQMLRNQQFRIVVLGECDEHERLFPALKELWGVVENRPRCHVVVDEIVPPTAIERHVFPAQRVAWCLPQHVPGTICACVGIAPLEFQTR